jgi:acetyl esterase/lipase
MDEPTPLTWTELCARAQPAPDAAEAYGLAAAQLLELSRPPGLGPFPVVVLLHGGCWLNRFDRGYCRHLAEALRQRGWAAVNVEYRRVGDPGGGWPGTFEDVVAAVRWGLGQFGTGAHEGAGVTVVGHSAGGHLALLAAVAEPRITAVVGLAAIGDLARYVTEPISCAEGGRRFAGGTDVPAAADPQQLPLPAASVHLVSGERDLIVPGRYGEAYAARGPSVDHQVIAGAGHFDLVAPWTAAGARVVEIIDRTRPARAQPAP